MATTNQRLTKLEKDVAALQVRITNLENDMAQLDARVTVLETPKNNYGQGNYSAGIYT